VTEEEYEAMLTQDCEHTVDLPPVYDHTWVDSEE